MVSDACTDECRHDRNALVHAVGDVEAIRAQFTTLHEDRALLERLRAAGLRDAPELTWTAAGRRLVGVYEQVVGDHAERADRRAA
jgi:hypothetical protein